MPDDVSIPLQGRLYMSAQKELKLQELVSSARFKIAMKPKLSV